MVYLLMKYYFQALESSESCHSEPKGTGRKFLQKQYPENFFSYFIFWSKHYSYCCNLKTLLCFFDSLHFVCVNDFLDLSSSLGWVYLLYTSCVPKLHLCAFLTNFCLLIKKNFQKNLDVYNKNCLYHHLKYHFIKSLEYLGMTFS